MVINMKCFLFLIMISLCYDIHHSCSLADQLNPISLQCFGLLGSNGAGKSTIFSMLSGELAPTSGAVSILNRDEGIAYCPQSNALDNLLTVQEIIYFYGKLRRITNIQEVNDPIGYLSYNDHLRHIIIFTNLHKTEFL